MSLTTVDQSQSETPECPECAAPVEVRPTLTGELVDCATCGVELEAVSLSPLRFALAPEVEEDWGE
jgi:alpha-aminoadipate/glutamate carrier protein LysW